MEKHHKKADSYHSPFEKGVRGIDIQNHSFTNGPFYKYVMNLIEKLLKLTLKKPLKSMNSRLAAMGFIAFCFLASDVSGQGLSKELITVKLDSWRSATIFTHAIWKDLLFYGGGSGSDGGDPRHEIEIGVFHLVSPDSGYHDQRNPIVRRAQFGLDRPGRGITPLSIFDRGDSLFMYCTSRPNVDLNPSIVVISASVDDPYVWSNYKVVVNKSFSGKENNHGASAIPDPDNPKNLLLYFAALSKGEEYRIMLATVPISEISNPKAYTLLNDYEHAVLERNTGKTNYPFVKYDGNTKEYQLWYSGHSIDNSRTRSSYHSSSKQKNSFQPATKASINPSADAARNDHAYATGPEVNGNYVYYSGRKEGNGDYRSIFCIEMTSLNATKD